MSFSMTKVEIVDNYVIYKKQHNLTAMELEWLNELNS